MDVVKISVNKLDTLAQTVSDKSGEALPLTLDEMNTAVANIQTGGGGGTMQEKNVSYTPTESAQSDTVTPSTGYDGLSKVNVSVGAIDSEYIGSDVPRKSSTDLTASGGTVSVPSGFYENNASKAVQTGTEGTPTATKGAVSNHAIAVTPSVTNSEGYISGTTKTGTAVTVSAAEVTSGNKSITSNGNNIDVVNYSTVSVNVPSQGVTLQTKSKTYTPTESQKTDTITADTGYDGLNEVDVTVEAIDSEYVGSDVPRKSSSDLTASGATVTAPAGYYNSSASKSVSSMTLPSATSSSHTGTAKATISRSTSAQYLNIPTGYNSTAQYYTVSAVPNGTEGTPTATKGTVSNHSVSVTPSVTNSEGYISGGTKTGTAVSVSASELVSGSETKTANGTYDVTNLAQLIVNVSGGGSSGLEYETGTWTPTENTADAWVDLSKTYTTPPFFYQIWDDTGTYDNTQNVNYSIAYFQGDRVFNNGLRKSSSSSSGYQYGWCYGYYRSTSSSSLSSFTLSINYAKSNTSTSGANYPRYWATESKIRASTNYASRVWKSTRTYKYIAIWAPTT